MKTNVKILHQEHDGGLVQTYNPATGEKLNAYRKQSREEASKVVDRAHDAFLDWRETPISKRAEIISRMGKLLNENQDELAEMMTEQMGKTLSESKQEVKLCAQICKYTAENGPDALKDEERETQKGRGIITYQPIGVILAMQPWNFPLYQVIRYSAANLLAGNTTVLKHAEICWSTAEKIQELFVKAGVPKDAFGLVFVSDETVDSLISHDKVRGVTVTGSAQAGRIVGEKAGQNLKKTVMELGGSDPYIILADADLDKVVPTCVKGRTNNAGQTCVAAKRFIIEESIYDEFKEKFVAAMKKVKYGDPKSDDTDMGPIARRDLREKLHQQVQDCIVMGAECLTGGEIPENEKGYFYPATVLENIKPGMPAYDDELFGPVASLFKARDVDDAIRIANDHRYGLGGGIFTADEQKLPKTI